MKENLISDKQREVLLIAQEECAEIVQAVSKCFRFGFDSRWPIDGSNNRENLTEEVGDFVAMVRLMVDYEIIDMSELEKAAERKMTKLKKWSSLCNDE